MTHLRNLDVALLFCCIILFSASSVYAPQTQDNSETSTDLPSITSQYNNIDPVSIDSDNALQAFASQFALSGDGSFETPYYFTRLNITGLSGPTLQVSNIRHTWFTFDDCMFQTDPSHIALEIFNVTKGHFANCFVSGAIYHNDSDFNVIMRSYIRGAVYIEDSLHTGLYHNTFAVDSPVFVMSFSILSTNVSFYDSNFLSELDLLDCTECYVMNNRFFTSVRDNGYANTWDGNSYVDYVGVGPYLILGTAGSIDDNPSALETSTIIWPGSTTTSTSGIRTTTTASSLTDNPFDDVLLGMIGIEIVVVILIVNIRKQSGQ
ncbi:MAG: hypothetical protein ACFFFC_05270 [Candidatus Thorarchaeota archaeon]